ncbi:hypothetical protein [Actinomadura chibensis]|uniref:hypothetical protein n=1 Tax=Actinomadura chibensis TaxID=392828 RepID=UPI0014714F6F|nr:hypothetical protein [Actinomadura chibensis]
MTIEKIPIVTESTAAQPVIDERDDGAVPTMDIDSVLLVGNAVEVRPSQQSSPAKLWRFSAVNVPTEG